MKPPACPDVAPLPSPRLSWVRAIAGGVILRSWQRGLGVLIAWLLAGAAVAGKPPGAAVLALLGSANEPPAAADCAADIARLHAHRAVWLGEPVSRLLVYSRLARDFGLLAQPDSLYVYLHLARHTGEALGRPYYLEASDVLNELGHWHWNRLAFDSAGYYFRTSADLLDRAGYSLASTRPVSLASGGKMVVGGSLASRLANAALIDRRHGDLPAATRRYERALRLYQGVADEAGLRWVQCLLGEAYEDQGADSQALAYYEQALATIGTLPANEVVLRASQYTDVMRYGADVLLRQRQAPQLLSWLRTGLAYVRRARQPKPASAAFANLATELTLKQAEAWLQLGPPDSAAAALAYADRWLSLLEADASQAAAQPVSERITWHCLQARLAQQQGRVPASRAQLARALALLPALTVPIQQARAREQLGDVLTQLGEFALAVRVLRPIVGQYRREGARLKVRDAYQLLEAAYAGRGQTDSAYAYARRYHALNDTLRAAQQYAALVSTETRYRTREKEQQISQMQQRAAQERRQTQLALLCAVLLAAGLAGVGWALRYTRRLNQRLADLDQLKTQFFANVSHELRTPLTLLVGPVAHLLEQAEDLSPTARNQLELTLRNGQRLQQLVNRLLDLTKLEAGRLQVQPAPVPLSLFLAQITSSFETLAATQGVTLTYSYAALPPGLTLLLDGDKLNHIVSNLLSNALKFTPAGGQVTVTADPAGPGAWQVRVADTGLGIAPDEQARVFERFYQSRTHQAQGGTGIGLALARELAELLGGTLTLESQVGRGSTFTLTLRAEEVSAAHPGLGSASHASDPDRTAEEEDFFLLTPAADSSLLIGASSLPAKARVLVVEDHADLRAYLRQVLEPRYEVLEAENGRAALALLATESVDLITSDEMMPLLSGTELLRSLRAAPQWWRVPFLMITARADAQHRIGALELGVDDYLQKPFVPRELLARVHNLLVNYRERQRYVGGRSEERGAGLDESEDGIEDEMVDSAALEPGTPHSPTLAPHSPLLAPHSPLLAPVTIADQELLRRFRELAEEAIVDPEFDAISLVGRLGLSERSFYRKLKELTGLTPAAYVRELRLERARRLLEARTTQTVSEVAYAVGFDNPGYFATVYYKRYGKRATDYLR